MTNISLFHIVNRWQ